MYAIRSYYDENTRLGEIYRSIVIKYCFRTMTCIGPTLNKSKEKGGPEAAFFLSCMKIGSRITSYNVCYTKLLRKKTIQLGAGAYITKPYTVDQLGKAIRNVLNPLKN